MSNRFESYVLDEDSDVGSFLSARYKKLNPRDVSLGPHSVSGSVLVVVQL